LSNPQHFAVVRAALDDVRNSLGSMSLIFKGRPDASCQDWRAPFAKSSTLPHDPVYVDKQIGVTEGVIRCAERSPLNPAQFRS
jgi:hypothetical protein